MVPLFASMTPTVFRPRKHYLWLGLASLGFFWGMAVLSCILYLVGEIPLLVLILGVVVWGAMSFLGLWLLLAYRRESLTIDGQTVTQRGVLFSRTLWLPDLRFARWIVSPEGAVALQSPLGRVNIYLGNFEPHERLLLIRLLRALLPEDAHRDWPAFCLKVALPLRRRCEWADSDSPPLGEGQVLVRRRRLDVYFAIGILLAVPLGIFSWWLAGNRAGLAVPAWLIAMWLYVRFSVPKRGFGSQRLSERKDKSPLLLCLAALLGLPVCFAAVRLLAPGAVGNAIMIVLGVTLLGLMMVAGYGTDRRRQQEIIDAGPAAVEEWELGEPPCPPARPASP